MSVAAGQSAEVTVPTDGRMWRRWNGDDWEALAPGGALLIARGLGDVRETLGLSR